MHVCLTGRNPEYTKNIRYHWGSSTVSSAIFPLCSNISMSTVSLLSLISLILTLCFSQMKWWIPAVKMLTENRRMPRCLMVCATTKIHLCDVLWPSLLTSTFSCNIVWVEDEGMEIKRQITGMMRLLSDKTGRVYQRVGTEQDGLAKEPQGGHLTWTHQPAALSLVSDDFQSNTWSCAGDPGPSPSSTSTRIPNGPGCGQYSTRSKAMRIHSNTKDLIKVTGANSRFPPSGRFGATHTILKTQIHWLCWKMISLFLVKNMSGSKSSLSANLYRHFGYWNVSYKNMW